MCPVWDRCLSPVLYLYVLGVVSGSTYPPDIDDVALLNPPEEAVPNYRLRIRYGCSVSAAVRLEALVSTDTRTATPVFQRHWSCEPGPPKIRVLTLQFPDWLMYRADWRIPDSEWVLRVALQAQLIETGSLSPHRITLARDVAQLQLTHPFHRPLKQHPMCLMWDTDLLWRMHKDTIPQCPEEQEVTHFLSSLFASTGETFGVTRTLGHYHNGVLEYLRLKAISFPWCLFSTWIYLTQPCRQRLCGIFYHLDAGNYATPALFLTSSGQLHIQVNGMDGASTAFLAYFRVPLGQWCRIDMGLQGREVNISMVCMDGLEKSAHSAVHMFRDPVRLDDTEGYFVLGGSLYIKGIEAFYGPSVYYRNRASAASESETSIPEAVRAVNLTGWFQSCQEFQQELHVKMTTHSQSIRMNSHFERRLYWTPKAAPKCEAPAAPQRRLASRLVQVLTTRHGGAGVRLASVGRALYLVSLRRLTEEPILRAGKVMPLLLQAGCLGDRRALYLSSVLYNSGLGVRRQASKARQLGLLAAQRDGRLALLHLGHLHLMGDQSLPPDPELAYAYYSNMAAQTALDRHTSSPRKKFVEPIHLNDEATLKLQTNENDDLFLWLKHQARTGVAEAEQALGRMLFWGQQGVSPDLQTAAKHYERGATRLEDPVSMYDYAIVLLRGQGVEKDIPKAVKFLKKAVDRDFVPAINALGWYYERYEQDYVRAVEMWERANALGSPEAPMNLGVLHSQGLYPGKEADQFVAYKYFLKAAQRRHVEGAVQLAEVWIRGIPGLVKRHPLDAVLWAKWVSEQNGHLGAVLRTALDAYLRRDWPTALVYYLMAAESGFAVAQFNVAYICEHNPGSFLDPAFATDCMRRYYNLSIHAQDPPPYALIKMGDLFYGSSGRGKRDVEAAAHLYKQAALRNDPQGWYSLGLLVQEGEELPVSLLAELNLLELHGADRHTTLTTLYRRCRDHPGWESYLPCSLALFHVHLLSAWTAHSPSVMFLTAVASVIISFLALLLSLRNPWERSHIGDRGQRDRRES